MTPSAVDAVESLPLDRKDALTLPEAAALGYGSERTLRQMMRTGRIKRAVLHVGRRGVRLLRIVLAEELRAGGRP